MKLEVYIKHDDKNTYCSVWNISTWRDFKYWRWWEFTLLCALWRRTGRYQRFGGTFCKYLQDRSDFGSGWFFRNVANHLYGVTMQMTTIYIFTWLLQKNTASAFIVGEI
jgi:hypothetical protein